MKALVKTITARVLKLIKIMMIAKVRGKSRRSQDQAAVVLNRMAKTSQSWRRPMLGKVCPKIYDSQLI